jgi:hypothetical protein
MYDVLSYVTVSSGRWVPIFLSNRLPPSSEYKLKHVFFVFRKVATFSQFFFLRSDVARHRTTLKKKTGQAWENLTWLRRNYSHGRTEVFSHVTIRCCIFHVGQAWFRKSSNLGLKSKYIEVNYPLVTVSTQHHLTLIHIYI